MYTNLPKNIALVHYDFSSKVELVIDNCTMACMCTQEIVTVHFFMLLIIVILLLL